MPLAVHDQLLVPRTHGCLVHPANQANESRHRPVHNLNILLRIWLLARQGQGCPIRSHCVQPVLLLLFLLLLLGKILIKYFSECNSWVFPGTCATARRSNTNDGSSSCRSADAANLNSHRRVLHRSSYWHPSDRPSDTKLLASVNQAPIMAAAICAQIA